MGQPWKQVYVLRIYDDVTLNVLASRKTRVQFDEYLNIAQFQKQYLYKYQITFEYRRRNAIYTHLIMSFFIKIETNYYLCKAIIKNRSNILDKTV